VEPVEAALMVLALRYVHVAQILGINSVRVLELKPAGHEPLRQELLQWGRTEPVSSFLIILSCTGNPS
jgi:hypothetical protein